MGSFIGCQSFSGQEITDDSFISTEGRRGEAKRFLDVLFGGCAEEGGYALIWELQSKRSKWFPVSELDAAAEYAVALEGHDVYVGVALSPDDHGSTTRLTKPDGERPPSALVCLWADIDIKGDGHKGKNYPQSVEEAKTVLDPDLPPSILVHSGGGLQAWWLLESPWLLPTLDDGLAAQSLSERFVGHLRRKAEASGWTIDSVHDLSRVLRVPGTMNCKIPGNHRPCRIIEENPRRYSPDEIKGYLDRVPVALTVVPKRTRAGEPGSGGGERGSGGGGLVFGREANPPIEKFDALKANDRDFNLAWSHKRTDLKDQSCSSYEMALANITAKAGWSDQEITDLLIAHRRTREPEKLDKVVKRHDYVLSTLAKARESVAMDRGEMTPHDYIESKTRLSVEKLVQHGKTDAVFTLHLRSGHVVNLGKCEDLYHPRKVQANISETIRQGFPEFTRKEWAKVVSRMFEVSEVAEVASREEIILDHLQVFFDSEVVGSVKEWNTASRDDRADLIDNLDKERIRAVVEEEGRRRTWFKLRTFSRWLLFEARGRNSEQELGQILSRAGLKTTKLTAATGDTRGRRLSGRVWVWEPQVGISREPMHERTEAA